MPATLKSIVRRLVPPLVTEAFDRRFRRLRFTGNYASWPEAQSASTGYDAKAIRDVVLTAARSVRSGHAAYERDGATFLEPTFVWTVAAALLREAAKTKDGLSVLDFGGSLASFYFQHRRLFRGLDVRWAVVEQSMFVKAGAREFADASLSFHADVENAVRATSPSVALFSSVLNYVEKPHAVLDDVMGRGLSAVIIDRTAITAEERDRLVVQHSQRHAYAASYPAWLLARVGVLRHFAADYDTVAEFKSSEPAVDGAEFCGFYFERRS